MSREINLLDDLVPDDFLIFHGRGEGRPRRSTACAAGIIRPDEFLRRRSVSRTHGETVPVCREFLRITVNDYGELCTTKGYRGRPGDDLVTQRCEG